MKILLLAAVMAICMTGIARADVAPAIVQKFTDCNKVAKSEADHKQCADVFWEDTHASQTTAGCEAAEMDLQPGILYTGKIAIDAQNSKLGYPPFNIDSPGVREKEHADWITSAQKYDTVDMRACKDPKYMNRLNATVNLLTSQAEFATNNPDWEIHMNLAIQLFSRCTIDYLETITGARCEKSEEDAISTKTKWQSLP
jgi:hypothetical protein